MHKLYRFCQLSGNKRSLLVQALVLLPIVNIALKIWGLQRTQTTLKRFLSTSEISVQSSTQLSQIMTSVQIVRTVARYNDSWTSCLKQSLVLWYLLRNQGIAADLQIGVQMQQQFQAHAWVEYQGYVIGDRQDIRQHYTLLDSLNNSLNS
ncbi:lasso peptide biosynthesis B2 protein [Aphanizomenon sp. CS-733/32]|uniref:lasso peptide biosynthesis B2 protein n=1 Tax=Aphanizomenon sp. CS-733/32 TaxID=3021715 RepID=UPI00232D80DC|nr:lasso peptide biosynthesis B2 protein [Aphanizomenon sp. CS-733/32]MDB9310674.1 lasso peptide biosynthesis B2 protein [Aphanizomenon sp. CS-733/32]